MKRSKSSIVLASFFQLNIAANYVNYIQSMFNFFNRRIKHKIYLKYFNNFSLIFSTSEDSKISPE